MQEKIDWYQEVVDLEPSSKLFFPLAKMLADTDVSRAVETLQRGLERHPEYIEARLFYVELLHKNSEQAEYKSRLDAQLSLLTPMLMRYAGFWQAWGQSISLCQGDDARGDGAKGDEKGLAIAFLGAMLQNPTLSMTDIFAKGLESLMGKQMVAEPVCNAPIAAEPSSEQAQPTQSSVAEEDFSVKAPSKDAQEPALAEEDMGADSEEGEEQFSLRTRSMAEVLAEQGDYAGAVAIYQELLQASSVAEEKSDLQSRIATLNACLRNENAAAAPAKEATVSSPGKDRVISVLEGLADRLESRAHS